MTRLVPSHYPGLQTLAVRLLPMYVVLGIIIYVLMGGPGRSRWGSRLAAWLTSFITLAFLISVADWLYQEFEVVALACSFKNFGYFMGLLRWPGLAFLGTGFIIWASLQGMKGAVDLGKGVAAFYLPHMLAIWLVGGYFIYFMLLHDVIPSLSDCHWGIKLFG